MLKIREQENLLLQLKKIKEESLQEKPRVLHCLDGHQPLDTETIFESLAAENLRVSSIFLHAKIKNQEVHALVDSGSCGNFISQELVQKLGLIPKQSENRSHIKTAGGQFLETSSHVHTFMNLTSRPTGRTRIVLRILPMSIPLVLGMPFLNKGAIIDFGTRTVYMKGSDGNLETLHTVPTPLQETFLNLTELSPLPSSEVYELEYGNIQKELKIKERQDKEMSELNALSPDWVLECPFTGDCHKSRIMPWNKTEVYLAHLKEGPTHPCNVLPPELSEYQALFHQSGIRIVPERDVTHHISTPPGQEPPWRNSYRIGPKEQQELKRLLDDRNTIHNT